MKKIGFILLGIICILFSSRWTLTAQAGAGTLLSLEDGEYAIEVTMTGGSGKASIQSPALLTVTDGTAYISITWSSSNYDYMVVDNRKYENESAKDANSHFTIPVLDLTKELTVRADTLAMGTPHEIEAQKHPEDYNGLLVRVAGYTAYFTELGKEVQDDIISRTSHSNIC